MLRILSLRISDGARCCLVLLVLGILFEGPACGGQTPEPLTNALREEFNQALRELRNSLDDLKQRGTEHVVDAEIFLKGLTWALRYDQVFTPTDITVLRRAVTLAGKRYAELASGTAGWTTRKGKVAVGYGSRVDGSVQPYGLVIPKNYDAAKAIRLDVVLHGSTQPVGMSELRFLSRFDDGDGVAATIADQPFIELHPLGRVENCYRWAGETDVFEAIDDVCRRYHIDRDRIVLRGMSMGASGTWHLGLKHPDRFVALGPYCGYVDTHRFSETPLPNFVRVGALPEHQELGLHLLDSIDYAANAGVVPVVACMGEKDVFFQAHVLMDAAMKSEGLTLVNLISPGTGHVIDPVTHAEQMRRLGESASAGLNHQPRALRFVTWTLKYSRCHWLQVLGLETHYSRAELAARWTGNVVDIDEAKNITRFAIFTPPLSPVPERLRIGTLELTVPASIGKNAKGIVIERNGRDWRIAGEYSQPPRSGKRPGIQGPIDDAFTTPFLCVRGTGKAWNPAVQAYADQSLQRFAEEWRRFFRGELPVKDDGAVTEEDVRTRNLILFGDPGSNKWIAKVLPQLPLSWTSDRVGIGKGSKAEYFPAAAHLPALIAPNPLPGAEEHYVVLNTGHTFHEAELAKLNYLLFPRWGDWAVLQIPADQPQPAVLKDNPVRAGYFNEEWQF